MNSSSNLLYQGNKSRSQLVLFENVDQGEYNPALGRQTEHHNALGYLSRSMFAMTSPDCRSVSPCTIQPISPSPEPIFERLPRASSTHLERPIVVKKLSDRNESSAISAVLNRGDQDRHDQFDRHVRITEYSPSGRRFEFADSRSAHHRPYGWANMAVDSRHRAPVVCTSGEAAAPYNDSFSNKAQDDGHCLPFHSNITNTARLRRQYRNHSTLCLNLSDTATMSSSEQTNVSPLSNHYSVVGS